MAVRTAALSRLLRRAEQTTRPIIPGDAEEIGWILRRLSGEASGAPLFAMGVSLGGNALLKWLQGETRRAKGGPRRCGRGVGPGRSHGGQATALGRGFNLVYTRAFLSTIEEKRVNISSSVFPDCSTVKAMRRRAHAARIRRRPSRAPLHDPRYRRYWTRASAKPVLGASGCRRALNARNDPFLPAAALPRPDEVSAHVALRFFPVKRARRVRQRSVSRESGDGCRAG